MIETCSHRHDLERLRGQYRSAISAWVALRSPWLFEVSRRRADQWERALRDHYNVYYQWAGWRHECAAGVEDTALLPQSMGASPPHKHEVN